MPRTIGVSTLAAALLLLSGRAWALAPAVHDDAGFFKPEFVKQANDIITEIKQQHGKDLLIETFAHAPAGKEEAAAEAQEQKQFFADWALQRARAEHVNGIYVLICKDPPYVKPAVGNQTRQKLFTIENRDHLGKILRDRFHKKEYDDGLLEAVRYVRSALDENDAPQQPGNQSANQPAGTEGPDTYTPYGGRRPAGGGVGVPVGLGGLGGCLCVGLVLIGVLAAGAMAVSALFRSFSHGPMGHGPGGYGGAPGGYGYGPGGYGGGGGGGFMSSILGGLFGGAAGSWAYDRFFGGHSSPTAGGWQQPNVAPPPSGPAPADTDYSAGGGGDFGGGGGDVGGGGDFGGGGGGDFGGGGGGDVGGGGGGDFGGGGGDAGGGGGF